MALVTYSDLTTSIGRWLHRTGDSNLTADIPDFVVLAEARMYGKLRVREMETTMSTVMASGVIAVPTNYVELKDAYITSTTPYGSLARKTAEWIYDTYPDRTATRQPVAIAREGSNFIFGAYPDSNYTVKFVYYNRIAALSGALNGLWTKYPGMWLYGSLLEAAPYLKNDSRMPVWQMKYDEQFASCRRESDSEYLSGGVLEITAA